MEINIVIDKYKNIRLNLFKCRYELNFFYKLILALNFACLTGLLAQLRFFIPGTPIPVTGQVFGVILAGVLIGTWGGLSQLMYIGIGAAGVPWFAGLNSGIGYIAGPTGGYLIGFILASFFIGFIVDRYLKSRKFYSMILLMFFSIFVLVYLPGLIYLYLYTGAVLSITDLITICILPFIAVDLIKVVIAASIATTITPKSSYGREVDV